MTLSASQTGVHDSTTTRTATMVLAGTYTASSARADSRTATMVLSATQAGAKDITGTRTAAMVLAASLSGTAHSATTTRTATMVLAGSISGTVHSAVSARTASMVLTTSYTAVHTSGGVTRTATMVLAASTVGFHPIVEIKAVVQRASLVVRYELLCVARIPSQSGAPTLIPVDPIDWTGLSYVDELMRPQQLTAGCTLSNLTDNVKQHLADLARQPLEMWLYRAGKQVFAGPLRTWQVQGESLTLQAAGLLDYTTEMVIDADTVFSQVDQFAIAAGLIDTWQNSPYGSRGIDTTSVGVSGVLRDATYLRKEGHIVGRRLEDLGRRENGFDLSVDPSTRKLRLAYPTQGVDRSIGEDAIVFDERNITNANVMCSAAPGDVASDGFGTGTATTGADPTYSTKWNDDLRVRYGRSGVFASFDGVSEQATLDDHVQALVNVRGAALMIPGPDVRVTPDTDLSFYDVGDKVFYRLNSLIKVEGGFRLRKRTVTVAKTGQESVSLAFA